jgi:hypothetical protein
MDADLSAMGLDNPFHDVQPEPDTPVRLGLPKSIEDVRQNVRGNPAP